MSELSAVEVSLAEVGEDAFLRLSRGLPALAADLLSVAKRVSAAGDALVVVPVAKSVSSTGTIPELLADLAEVVKAIPPEDVSVLNEAAAALRSFTAWRVGKSLESTQDSGIDLRESVGVFLRVPPRIASRFPSKDEDPSPIHATLLMVGDCTRDEFARVVDAVQRVARSSQPFGIELTDYGEFENRAGATIPHMIPRSEGASLDELHKKLRAEVEGALGRTVDHHPGPFKSHVTLDYVPKGEKYEGPRPSGRFKASSIEVWGSPGGEFGRSVIGFGSGEVLREISATKAAPGDTCSRCKDPIPCMHFAADGSLTETGRRANERVESRKDEGSGDLSSGDLAHAGGLSPAQGGKKKIIRTAPSKAFPEDVVDATPTIAITGPAIETAVAMSAEGLEAPQGSTLSAKIVKSADDSEEERTVFGIVLEPDVVDSQNDTYDADEIRETAYKFAERYQQFGLMHRQIMPGILLLETYCAPVDFVIEDHEGQTRKIKRGTWLLRVRVLDDEIWTSVKAGDLTGFSIGGSAMRRPTKIAAKSSA